MVDHLLERPPAVFFVDGQLDQEDEGGVDGQQDGDQIGRLASQDDHVDEVGEDVETDAEKENDSSWT